MMIVNKILSCWKHLSHLGTDGLSQRSSKRVILTNRICLFLGLTSFFFIFPWAAQANVFMVSINVLLVLIYSLVIWLNKKHLYDIPKFFLIFFVSTPVFIVTGMLGRVSHLHFSLIPIAGFSILLFDRKEKLKIAFAIGYPTLLLAILIAFDFKLFPNMVGNQIEMLPVYDYFLNFAVIISTMLCFYHAYIKAEDSYQNLYEEHIKAQKQLDEERAKAIYSTKMAALGEMAGGIAHEINGPLSIITNLSFALQTGIPKNSISQDKILEYTQLINKTCLKISKIIKSLSSISRSSNKDPFQDVDLQSLIQETLVLCHHRFYLKSITIEVKCDENLPSIHCRPVEIGQVLLNLLNNAYDAILEVKTPKVIIKARPQGDKVILTVEDNGQGISPEIGEKVFETFYTSKEIGKGTGLGLSISRKIMEANGGCLYFKSKPGSTEFMMEFKTTVN